MKSCFVSIVVVHTYTLSITVCATHFNHLYESLLQIRVDLEDSHLVCYLWQAKLTWRVSIACRPNALHTLFLVKTLVNFFDTTIMPCMKTSEASYQSQEAPWLFSAEYFFVSL